VTEAAPIRLSNELILEQNTTWGATGLTVA